MDGVTILICSQRPGESPAATEPMRDIQDYSSHNEWGTGHFGFMYDGDLTAFLK
jgi:hypothetical protein